MTTIPPPQKPDLITLIDLAHEKRTSRPRPHLGCSQLGHHCDRYLWLSFRWAAVEKFPGRILRLFRRGHHEEGFVVSDLRAAGLDVQETGSQQARVDFGCHVSGSIDGIIRSGVPESSKPHVLEIKTHSDKSFKELAKGVQTAKPMHWVQCQLYMLGKKLDRALYVAVNKNDDSLHVERVRLEKEVAEEYVKRGHRIATANRMPEPCHGASPSWYLCKFCPGYAICHLKEPTQQVNCRTCAHSTAEQDGTWTCARHGGVIPTSFQHEGCESHVLHPDMVPWELDPITSTETVAAWRVDGVTVRNGDPRPGVYSSKEMLANLEACKVHDGNVDAVRELFSARVVG